MSLIEIPYWHGNKRNVHDLNLCRLLQDSLGGNCKTIMIATIASSQIYFYQTENTLRYADQAKKIKCKPLVNKDNSVEELIKQVEYWQALAMQCNPDDQEKQELLKRLKDYENEKELLRHEISEVQRSFTTQCNRIANEAARTIPHLASLSGKYATYFLKEGENTIGCSTHRDFRLVDASVLEVSWRRLRLSQVYKRSSYIVLLIIVKTKSPSHRNV